MYELGMASRNIRPSRSIDRRIVAAALKKVALMFAELMNPRGSELSEKVPAGRGEAGFASA
jgi:hypothetical protein